MDSLDGLRLLIVNCMQERGEDPPSLRQFITPATFRPFKCQSRDKRSLLLLYWVDRLPDKVHLGADKDVKDETLIRFRKTGIPDRGSLRKKTKKQTALLKRIICAIVWTCILTYRSNPVLSPAGWMTSQGSWSSPVCRGKKERKRYKHTKKEKGEEEVQLQTKIGLNAHK